MDDTFFTVTDTPQQILSGRGHANQRHEILIMVPSGGDTVWVGTDLVDSTTRGFPIAAGQAITVALINEPLYAVTATEQVIYRLISGGGA